MGRNDHDRNSGSVIGKLRSNFLGTEYHIYDDGKNPEFDESHYDEKNDGGEITDLSEIRCELGVILYAANTSLGAKGPRKMSVYISRVDEYGNPLKVWQPMKKDDESISTCLKTEKSTIDKVVLLENKPPSWNNDVKASVLNFNGRVTMASVKNFQLCTHDNEKQIMQFGRVGDNEFILDVRWPMSLLQAFSIALSSFDSKLGCD
jgi:tubby-related protein 1